MAKNRNDNNQQPIEGEVIPSNPTPRKQVRLSSIKDCRLLKQDMDLSIHRTPPE